MNWWIDELMNLVLFHISFTGNKWYQFWIKGIILCLQGETLIARCSMENTGPETKVREIRPNFHFSPSCVVLKWLANHDSNRAGHRDVQGPGDVRCLPALQVGHDQVSKLFNKQISKLIFNKRNTFNETSCSQDQWSASSWSPFLLPQWTTEDLGKHWFSAEK